MSFQTQFRAFTSRTCTKEKQRNSSLETVTFVICVAVLNSFGSEVTVIGRFERHKGGRAVLGCNVWGRIPSNSFDWEDSRTSKQNN